MKETDTSTTAISCKNLSIGYGKEVVMAGIEINIKKGTYLPFVGPNGAGKTTFLRTILGLLPPLAGSLEIADKSPPGYVPQISTLDRLYPVTARQVMYMGFYPRLGFWRKPDQTMLEHARNLINRFSLTAHIDRPIEELSGGMRQKVMIARALLSGADLLVMDEPAAGLDEKSEFALIEFLYKLCQEEKKTVLFAQHSLAPILVYAKEVCLFKQGTVKIVEIDELERPLQQRINKGSNLLMQEKNNV
jgi:ABC-type Mn2+/Zn2+ transport system ATPase subunit